VENNITKASILESFRVLDLTDEKGFLCGKILADLGADVIKVEKPGGDKSRNIGPFHQNIPHLEKSLYWFAYNLNKRGITLNIEAKDGQEIFRRLVKTSDFVIESFPVGYMDELGLGYSALSKINPRIVITSITAFGQTGPYKNYKASDIVGMAMGGLMYITGTPEHPPVRISSPQAYLQAAAHAAAATMIAHYYRETTGEGQHVDVSMQQCVVWGLGNAIPLWELNQIILRRVGSYLSGRWTGTKQRLVWECEDGYVLFVVMGGAFGAKTNRGIAQWMQEERMTNKFLQNMDWDIFDMAKQTQEQQDQVEEPIARFFMTHTKAELYEEALKRGIMLAPVSSPRDILENTQLKARGFWVDVEHHELGSTIRYLGAFVKASETPCVIKCRAPLIGEHNLEVYEGELGLSRAEMCVLKQAGII
jgi:crotonobetainyl-CoA:carnitine CoA-transferase CaiB-like acyl-CoA transferase